MIDIDLLRRDFETVAANLAKRGVTTEQLTELLTLDESWRKITERVEHLRAEKNAANDAIARAAASEKKHLIDQMKQVSTEAKSLVAEQADIAAQRDQAWRAIPNLVADDVPAGGEADFVVVTEPTTEPSGTAAHQDYFALAEPHWIDLARASKVSGSRFVYIKGQLARLELALAVFAIDTLTREGFTPVIPPVLISRTAMAGMGYLEHGEEEIYRTQDDLYLVGTSEQALGPMHMNETLPPDQLPLRYAGISPCFRREAGSHGKDVRGILRLHQFDKIEMFSFTSPEQSATEHEFLLQMQRQLMDALELPYRVIKLASRDLGAPAAKTYDIETWLPSEQRFRETHSTSNTTDYQSRRLNIRTKNAAGATVKAHLLNGTALAMSRILIALLENHQQADGSVAIPPALHAYLPFTQLTSPE